MLARRQRPQIRLKLVVVGLALVLIVVVFWVIAHVEIEQKDERGPPSAICSWKGMDSRSAPWNNRYQAIQGVWVRFHPQGKEVFTDWKTPDIAVLETAVKRVDQALEGSLLFCGYSCGASLEASRMTFWLFEKQGDDMQFMFLLRCPKISPNPLLAYAPMNVKAMELTGKIGFHEAYNAPPHIYVVTTFACRLDHLYWFLRHTGKALHSFSEEKHTIIVYWAECDSEDRLSPDTDRVADLKNFFVREVSQTIELKVVEVFHKYIRTELLNRALAEAPPGVVVMALDVDVMINTGCVMNSAALVGNGGSVVFPIMFSRFNPKQIALKDPSLNLSNWTISATTGIWRVYSYGNVVFHSDDIAKAQMSFDATIQEWGDEDVLFYEHLKANTKLGIFRAFEPGLVHLWHPKDCSRIQDPGRKSRCQDVARVTKGGA